MYINRLDTILASRFSSTNANGLWEYSLFLCVVGLVEDHNLSYCFGMSVWDRLPESVSGDSPAQPAGEDSEEGVH